MIYLTLCRRSLHLGVISFMLDLGKNTVYWIFVGWAVFLESCCDVFSGSISDSALIEKSGVLDWVDAENDLVSDRRFPAQENCVIKEVFLNCSTQESSNQYCNVEITSNFDIATCRIHVKRFVGSARDWSILNSV